MSDIDKIVDFCIVVSTCNAATTNASSAVFNAFGVSAAAFCTTVSYSGAAVSTGFHTAANASSPSAVSTTGIT